MFGVNSADNTFMIFFSNFLSKQYMYLTFHANSLQEHNLYEMPYPVFWKDKRKKKIKCCLLIFFTLSLKPISSEMLVFYWPVIFCSSVFIPSCSLYYWLMSLNFKQQLL